MITSRENLINTYKKVIGITRSLTDKNNFKISFKVSASTKTISINTLLESDFIEKDCEGSRQFT